MLGRWSRRLAIPVAALAAAEVGHLVTYAVKFGPAAFSVESDGGHRYLPSLLALAAGTSGALVLVGLLLVALARLAGSRPAGRPIPYLNLATVLLALQLAIFGCQEAGEALAIHAAPPGAAELAFWGIFGQLLPALLTALILRRLLAEVELAIEVLDSGASVGFAAWPAAPLALAAAGPSVLPRDGYHPKANPLRGPPPGT